MREAVDREYHKANVTPRNKDERTTARRGWLENSSPEMTGKMSFVLARKHRDARRRIVAGSAR